MFSRQLDFIGGAQKRHLGRDADLESAGIKGAVQSWAPVRYFLVEGEMNLSTKL